MDAAERRRRACCALLAAALACAGPPPRAEPRPLALELRDTRVLRIGIGDRLDRSLNGRWVPVLDDLDALELRVDLLQLWLPHGWQRDWIDRAALDRAAGRGITPVVVHHFFGDAISAERMRAQRRAWHASLRRMARALRAPYPVLVVLEPEFNDAPPPGETPATQWPGFAAALGEAVRAVREIAPNARIGTCAGDFAGPPELDLALAAIAPELDFLAFQEMRARTRQAESPGDYLQVARSALDYARYLKRAFGRPLLLAYVAVSSYGGWEGVQASVLRDLAAEELQLREAGVFGLIYFQLYDDPAHRGFFGPAEPHFGLLDASGAPKPALAAFRELLGRRSAARP